MSEYNLCYGCMNPKDTDENGICKLCGYNESAPHLPSYLAPGTVLNERYIVGKLKSYNGESASYMGF
ncbi:MAG: serine/threonine protein kinase, partial [Oscillospiraceae bacterium]